MQNKLYKDDKGEIYSFSPLQIEQGYADGFIELTPEEIEAHLNPQPTTEELAESIRAKRDAKIEALSWRLERYERQKAGGLETTDTGEWYLDALQYLQALRDVPQQPGFPHTVEWPEESKEVE